MSMPFCEMLRFHIFRGKYLSNTVNFNQNRCIAQRVGQTFARSLQNTSHYVRFADKHDSNDVANDHPDKQKEGRGAST